MVILTKQKRTKIMSSIKGNNTKPALILFEALDSLHIHYEKHYTLLVNPDIVIQDIKLAIFVDGAFWHGYEYKTRKDKLPEYWFNKIKMNMPRDRQYNKALRCDGWLVIRAWEHQILNKLPWVFRKIKKNSTKAKKHSA